MGTMSTMGTVAPLPWLQWYSGYHGHHGALHLGMGTMGALVQWYHGTIRTMGTKGTTGHATVGAMV